MTDSDSAPQISEAIILGNLSRLSFLLQDRPAHSFNSEVAGEFLGLAVARRRANALRLLLSHGFLVTHLDPYMRTLPASLGHSDIMEALK